jgi:APA family basic amino acid/polyamine antiporter
MTGITGAIPYAFSALAQIKWRIADGRAISRGRMVRDVGIAAVALIFSVLFIVYSTNSEAEGLARYQPFLFALGAYLIGLPVYWYNRHRMTEPGPVPPPVEARA